MTIVLFLIILGALIFVHELGHFISAKKAGIRVDEFALGFPPRIVSKKLGETVYSLNLIPFGGFVKIFGEDGLENADLTQTDADSTQMKADTERLFTSKTRWTQAFVLSSGVLGNIVFAWLLISTTFLFGVPFGAEGRYAEQIQDAALTIVSVLPDSPAEKAGIKSGDAILSLRDGERIFEGANGDSARAFIQETKDALLIQYKRGELTASAEVVPVQGIVEGKPAIGVSLETVGVVRFGFFRAFFEGFLTTADLLREVTIGLFGFIAQAFRGEADFGAITGPVGIAGLVGEARTLGLVYLLSFTAFISINLAVINLLPVPALDGGRLLFLGIEGIIRRPIPVRITRALNAAGFVLLILLMVVITYRDIVRMI